MPCAFGAVAWIFVLPGEEFCAEEDHAGNASRWAGLSSAGSTIMFGVSPAHLFVCGAHGAE